MSKRKLNKQNHSYKSHAGEEVKPIFFYSREAKFMAAVKSNGELVTRNGSPVPYKSI